MIAKSIVCSIEGRGTILDVRDGRLYVSRTQDVPAYLIRAARDEETEIVTFLEARAERRRNEREAHKHEMESARQHSKLDLIPPSKRIAGPLPWFR